MQRFLSVMLLALLPLTACDDDPSRPDERDPVNALDTARIVATLGQADDQPLPADADGDGADEFMVYRPSTGQWFGYPCLGMSLCAVSVLGGAEGDVPVPGDYDGDGTAQPAVFRPATTDQDGNGVPDGYWFLGENGCIGECAVDEIQWGQRGDLAAPADYDGDGATEVAILRRDEGGGPNGGFWYVSLDNCSWTDPCPSEIVAFGGSGDHAVPADYDGDGMAELAIYRPVEARWRISLPACVAGLCELTFGAPGAIPLPGDYDGDGVADLAYYHPATAQWHIRPSGECSVVDGCEATVIEWGEAGMTPVPADYDGDGTTDLAVYRLESGMGVWYVR